MESTCTAPGSYNSVVYCTKCGAQISRETINIPAKGHSFGEWKISTEATCTEKGVRTRQCAGCAATETEEISAKGHTLQPVEAKAATCTEPGHSAYYACGNCGKAFKDEAGQQETTVEAEIIAALGHTYGVPVFTWAEDGKSASAAIVCSVCDEQTEGHILSANADVMVRTSTAGDCQTVGTATYTASVVLNGTTYEEEKTVEGAYGPHKLALTEAQASTCTAAGNSAYYTCERCGAFFSDEAGMTEIEKDSWVIAAKGHAMTSVEAKAATCTEPGHSAYYACGNCGKAFKDEAGQQETTVEAVTIPATGEHSYSVEVADTRVEPTCAEAGSVQMKCAACEATQEQVLPIKPENHTENTEIKDAADVTCAEDGYTGDTYCKDCGVKLESGEIIPATGEHNYATAKEKVDATCTEDGYVIMACGCGETRQTALPATGHTPGEAVKEKETAANCTTAGSYDSVVNCATCGEEMSRETVSIDAVGHIDANADGVCDACEAELEVPVTYTVTVHGGSGAGSYAEGASVSITADAPESGRQFAGWTGAEGLTFTSGGVTVASSIFTMPARDVELTAAYEDAAPAGCVITFNANGGTGAMDAVTVTAGAAFALPECGFTAPEGQQFVGWALSADGAAIASPAAFAADTTLYAVWEAIPAVEEETPVINQTSSADVAAQEGGAVTMTVSAVNAARYQWYVNSGSGWVAIPGANSASYTVSVNAETSGTQYYCQVSNENGSTSSQIFQLRVLAPETVPQTGDDAQLGLWFVLMLLSAAGMTALAADRKRKAN